jgi:hypothetical protein
MSKKEDTLKRIIELPDTFLIRGGDPFVIDVDNLLVQINQNRIKDQKRSLNMESAALNSVSKIIKEQQDWVIDALRGLKLDPELLRQKLASMDVKKIAQIMANHAYPSLGIHRLSRDRIRVALEYFGLVEPWGRKEGMGLVQRAAEQVSEFFPLEKELESEAMMFYEELSSNLKNKKEILYEEVIGRDEMRLRRAFYIAYLSSTGKISVRRNSITGETLIGMPLDGDFESLAIPLG